MKLGAFLPAPGHHLSAWRHPRAKANGGHDFSYYLELAKICEQAKFHFMFLSDGAGIRTHYNSKEELSKCRNVCAVAQKRGIHGFVIDGVIRDFEEIKKLNFPVFTRGLMPKPGDKKLYFL